MKATSCLQCREAKRRCVKRTIDSPCNNCQRKNLACSSQVSSQTTSASKENHESVTELTAELAIEFVESYLTHLDGRPHSIFHQETLRRQVRRKEIGNALLYSICALGSKFSPKSEHRVLENSLTKEAKRLVQADLENVCIENVQTCILLSLLSAGNCHTSSETLFLRIAIGMAEVLQLNFSADDTNIVSETALRTWWSLYILDRWCSSGLGIPRHLDSPHCPDSSPLPIDETSFKRLGPSSLLQNSNRTPGVFAHMVTLIQHFGHIQGLNRAMAKGDMVPKVKCDAIKLIGQKLESWRTDLPENMQMTIQNIYSHQQNDLGGHFIALHLVFHHLSALVYFNSLETKEPSYIGQEDHIALCKSHASSFSSLLHTSRQMSGCQQNYPTVGHMTTVASAVLLHTLLLGEPGDIPKARQELNTNFEALIELRQYWPATEAMVR
ncbi:putative transcriptional regulatory protein [Fusarium oxysporum f. sp. rapae]|uniref:Putative transcriptional regulatory protein n=1 Tax=Fusarium oxysporum f. sp. rapae TaxID=485398 RepID=A0A8J5P1P8_FUSOX|nr:putative transcriptional regulatory protein [Fusarium oxysporum f. sp. rapae]